MEWQKKIQVKKGNIGENIVKNFLEQHNFIVYEPITDKAHTFDKIAIKQNKQMILIEVKTKARLTYFNATGFNFYSFETYQSFSKFYNLPMFIFFVDEYINKVYGQWIHILEKSYVDEKGKSFPTRINNNKIIIFSLEVMKNIANLTIKDSEELKLLSTRNYSYIIEKDH